MDLSDAPLVAESEEPGKRGQRLSEAAERSAARDAVLINAIASGRSYTEAALQARCTSRTVSRRMTDPGFVAQVDTQRSEWVSQTSGSLTALGPAAVTALARLLDSSEPIVQLRAIREVLSQGFRSRQLIELETEMRALRDQIDQIRNDISGRSTGGSRGDLAS